MNRKDNIRLAATMPGVPPRTPQYHDDIAEEAIRYGQRYLDQVAQIEALTLEVEQWRSKATTAETEVERMKRREQELIAQHDKKVDQMTRERDTLKQTLTVISTQYASAAKILLDGIDAINAHEPMRVKVNMSALAASIEHKPNDPLGDMVRAHTHGDPSLPSGSFEPFPSVPGVVVKGPRGEEGGTS